MRARVAPTAFFLVDFLSLSFYPVYHLGRFFPSLSLASRNSDSESHITVGSSPSFGSCLAL